MVRHSVPSAVLLFIRPQVRKTDMKKEGKSYNLKPMVLLVCDAKTTLDKDTGLTLIFFMADENTIFDTAQIILESDEGIIRLANDEEWHVKFSEKNEVMYMTIKDTNDKTVYYQQK